MTSTERVEPPSRLVHNERVKLTAGWLNMLAGASIATGFIAPIVAAWIGLQGTASLTFTLALSGIRLILGGCLHLFARAILGRLEE
jgi:predicted phage tail protein